MTAFKYEILDDGIEVYAVTWNDKTAWICEGEEAPIWKELLEEQGRKVTILPKGEYIAKVKLALGIN